MRTSALSFKEKMTHGCCPQCRRQKFTVWMQLDPSLSRARMLIS